MISETSNPGITETERVERVGGLSLGEFVRRYRRPRRPVILTDALKDWSARERFTPEFFRSRYGEQRVKVRGREYRLAEVIDLQRESSVERPAPYPCTLSLADCPDLLPDITPRFRYSLPNRHTNPLMPKGLFESVYHTEVFFGGPNGQFPLLHYDFLRLHTWIAQVHGDKEFTFYEPGQEHLLYVDPKAPWLSTVERANSPDFERYPLLRQARSYTVTVRAGEAMWLPCGTWHTARCLNVGITVAFDQLEASNWRDFTREVIAHQQRLGQRARAFWLGSYLKLLGPVLGVAELFGANQLADWGLRAPDKKGVAELGQAQSESRSS
ncbi:MAG: cupin-like domain-containing protein [Proteobacteria bacterium]|nr:cupin-like domain-containing protein [Pseudomonadota bacterium]